MRVLFFGTYDVSAHPRVQVLKEGFGSRGYDVEECNVPLGFDTSMRVDATRSPVRAVRFLTHLVATWIRLLGRSLKTQTPDFIVVGYLGQFDVHLARLRWPQVPIILDYLTGMAETAIDRRVESKLVLSILRALDRAGVSVATYTLVDTDENLLSLPAYRRDDAHVVPVGAPLVWFQKPAPSRRERLRVVFYGLYTPLQGTPVIGRAIRALEGVPITFTMVGSGQDFAATRNVVGENAAVEWLDWVPATELPALVAEHDVCLGIFGDTEKAQRVVPNKVFQGAAAGCIVVTSDTPPQRRMLNGVGVFVPPGDHHHLAAVLSELADHRDQTDAKRFASYGVATKTFRPEIVLEPVNAVLIDSFRTSV